MAKQKTQFACSKCGSVQPKWAGQCPDCEEWNSLDEVAVVQAPKGAPARQDYAGSSNSPLTTLASVMSEHPLGSLPNNAEELSEFIQRLCADLDKEPDKWANVTLPSFLGALGAVFKDHQEHMLKGHTRETIPYRLVAEMLFAASLYE